MDITHPFPVVLFLLFTTAFRIIFVKLFPIQYGQIYPANKPNVCTKEENIKERKTRTNLGLNRRLTSTQQTNRQKRRQQNERVVNIRENEQLDEL